jgi:outer membrane protein assembly factor BamA
VEGETALDEAQVRKDLKVKAGDRRSFWELQDDADRLRAALVRQGYLESVVDARLEEGVATFRVRAHSRYDWQVEGMASPPDLRPAIEKALFEEEALELGRDSLLAELRRRGHVRATVATSVRATPALRTLAFQVDPGPVLAVSVRFPGASAFADGRLAEITGGPGRILGEPEAAADAIVAAYREAHYLTATAGPSRVREGGDVVEIEMPVHEGPRATVTAIRFEGASRPEAELLAVAGLQAGAFFDEAATLRAIDALRAHYFGLGFPSVRASSELQPTGADFVQVLHLVEGPQVTVGPVVIQGATRTRVGLVRRMIDLRPGEPLDPRRLSALERHLSNLGVFSRVAVSFSDDSPATVTVTVQEGERVRALYQVTYEDGPEAGDGNVGGRLDASLRNLFGWGLNVGGRLTVGSNTRELRADAQLPLWFRRGRLSLSVFREDEDFPSDQEAELPPDEQTRTGFQIAVTNELSARWKTVSGYRYDRSQTFLPLIPLETVTATSALDVSALYDSRDNVLDARRGRFASLAVEYAPPGLGGDLTFVKGLSQFILSLPVGESLTWAQAYRVGLAHGFQGQQLRFDDRFKAGGANTVRGFETDSLGPTDPLGRHSGQATLIFNQELRYRYRWGLGGVAFWDAGQVFDKASDLSLDLRHALGLGMRWESPVGLLRVDVGFPLQRREDEERYQLFFSIGQAF